MDCRRERSMARVAQGKLYRRKRLDPREDNPLCFRYVKHGCIVAFAGGCPSEGTPTAQDPTVAGYAGSIGCRLWIGLDRGLRRQDASTMKALVTGGGGFLGSRISRMLRERGDEVTVLGRSVYPQLETVGIRTIRGDVRDAAVVRAACQNVDTVFHCAAKAGVWGPRREYLSINVGGTRNVLDACRANGVSKLVYTSTPSVVFGKDDLCGVDESQPYPDGYLAAYPETKAAAERMVLAANGPHLATIALRPHLIWGPGDPHLIPRVLDRARRGRLVRVGDGRNLVDITYVENAALAHVLAADVLGPGGRCAGKAYFLSQGEPVCLWSWIDTILAAAGLPRVTRSVSFRTAYLAGAAMEVLYRSLWLATEPPMTRFVATQLAKAHYFNISAARVDIGEFVRVTAAVGVERLKRSWHEQAEGGRQDGRGATGSRGDRSC